MRGARLYPRQALREAWAHRMARLQALQQPHCQGPPLLGHSFYAPATNYNCFSFLYQIKQENSGPLVLSKWHFSKVLSREELSRTVYCDVLYGSVCRICLVGGGSSSGRLSGNIQGLSSLKPSLLRQDLTPRWRHQQEDL